MKTLQRLAILVRPFQGQMIAAALMLLSLTAIDMVFPAIIRQVIDVGFGQGQTQFMLVAAGIIMGLGFLKWIINFGYRYTSEWLSHHIAFDLRNDLYNHIQRLPFTYHDYTASGQLISRVIEDVRSMQNFTGNGIFELSRTIILMIGILIILFFTQPLLAAIALVPMIPLVWLNTSFGRRIGKMFLAVDQSLGELSERLQENVNGVQVVRAFAREKYEVDRFRDSNRKLYYNQIKVVKEMARTMPTSTLLIGISTMLILWFGGQMALNGQISLGELVAFNSYVLLLSGPAQQLSWLINAAGESSAGLERTFEVLDKKPEIRSPESSISLPDLRGEVTFENVSFRYRYEKDHALHDINLTVHPNQVIALVGPTGSGKTSLMNLIPRFYDVTAGAVKVDGVDVRQLDLKTLRSQIGIVLQTSLLFSATIAENIAYGHPTASMDEIIAAAKAAQAHDFITEQPKGYQTVVGERGITLSGGQRQRVAIARALLLNPRILILDDSTSSVDTQTEHLIQEALKTLMQGRTTFVIAQRLTTVHRADVILVLDQGRIAQQGTHDELLQQPGLYREIYDLQLRDQERFQQTMAALQKEKVTSAAAKGGKIA